MATSKYVAHLETQVQDWQRKLALVDRVLNLWSEMQRTWSHLESIFAGSGSENIRQKLPQDSQRFDETNAHFKDILTILLAQKNLLSMATVDGIVQQLQKLDEQLQLCEKALCKYLDSKKIAFPRFYFIATTSLMDILSNGNNPLLVQRSFTVLLLTYVTLKSGF